MILETHIYFQKFAFAPMDLRPVVTIFPTHKKAAWCCHICCCLFFRPNSCYHERSIPAACIDLSIGNQLWCCHHKLCSPWHGPGPKRFSKFFFSSVQLDFMSELSLIQSWTFYISWRPSSSSLGLLIFIVFSWQSYSRPPQELAPGVPLLLDSINARQGSKAQTKL